MGSSSSDDKEPASSDFTSNDEFHGAPSNFSPVSSSSGGLGSSGSVGGSGSIEQFSVALQEQLLVQQAISTLTDKSFEKCILGKPSDSSLSSRELECISSTVGKWIDTNEFMMGRLGRKAEKQFGAGAGAGAGVF